MPGDGAHRISSPLQLGALIGFLIPWVAISQIPLGSKVSVEENRYWISSNGNFAAGFLNHSDQPNLFSVGIRFNSVSIPAADQKVVWVAGADVAVSSKSFFQLMQSGELVLFDSARGFIVWSSKTGHLSVTSALIRDNGNLVLMNHNKVVVWQSFDTPSDTLLPGQYLTFNRNLRAASRSSVSSYYTFSVNVSGQLQLKWETDVRYWTSGGPFNANASAVLTPEGALQLLDNERRPLWSLYGEDHNDSVGFRFLKLDVDGNLRIYSWVEAFRSWKSVWQAVENQCDVFATCNLSGICVFAASGLPICKCLFLTATESSSKCLVPYEPKCNYGFTWMRFEHTSLYGIYPPSDFVITSSLQQCKNLCINDPQCTAVTYSNDGTAQCRMKNTSYVTGSSYPSLRSISFVKSCLNPVAVMPNFPAPPPPDASFKSSFWLCFRCQVGVALGLFMAFILFHIGICLFFYKRRNLMPRKSAVAYLRSNTNKGLVLLSYAEIEQVTEKFKHQMGLEAFKGVLPGGQEVVVRNLKAAIDERKFRNTVHKLGSMVHKNLLKLQGYCCDSSHRYLVYELPKNGSLAKYINNSKKLSWRKRMEICLSVARAVSYLHSGCREFFNHGDLTCENVVLGEDLEARVTEFGLSRLQEEASSSAGVVERDVENFGKIILTLITGRLEVDEICRRAYEEWISGNMQELVDKMIHSGLNVDELERVLRVAFWCLQVDERSRPSMGEVVKVLEGTLTVDPPPPPFLRRMPSEEESLEPAPEAVPSGLE